MSSRIHVLTLRGTAALIVLGQFSLAPALHSASKCLPHGSTSSSPVVCTVSPDHAPNSGASGVVITGSNLTGATQVLFGPNAVAFSVDSDTQITANLGAVSTMGWVDVSVTNSGGTGTLMHAFDYFVPPELFGDPSACTIPITWSGSPTLGQNYTITLHPGSYRYFQGVLRVSLSNRRLPFGYGHLGYLVPPIYCGRPYYVLDYTAVLAGTPLAYTFVIPNDVTLIGSPLRVQGHFAVYYGMAFGVVGFTQALNAVIGE